MREETKAELDHLFKKKYHIAQERRKDPRVTQFASHLLSLEEFDSVREQIIRPLMDAFGRYLEALGHRYYIGSVQDLAEGHLHPTSKITLHIFLNANTEKQSEVTPSLSFRIDDTSVIYLYQKTGPLPLTCSAVGHYDVHAITRDIVESHIKKFIIETISKG